MFSTTANQTRIFLGVPGLQDAAYVVKRSEVRKNVSFPTAMCTTVGGWGRGVGTTGYREEQGRCFGEGICEIVPGTLTSTSATLRTWIYEVWSITGQYLGFFPRSANNVVFQYTLLGVPTPTTINGDNIVCATSNLYTIPNLPAGATVAWSATPLGIVTINSPNSSQTTITKNNDAVITLKAVISNVCTSNITLTKQVTVGVPVFAIQANVPCQPGSIVQTSTFTVFPISGAPTTYHWRSVSNGISTNIIGSGPSVSKKFTLGSHQVYCWGQNACGSNDEAVVNFQVLRCPSAQQQDSSSTMLVSPNPATSTLNVEVNKESQETTGKVYHIETIELIDKSGNISLRKQFGKGLTKISLSVSGLPTDYYTLRVFDGEDWTAYKIIIQH